MSTTMGIVVYLVVWWLTLFLVLPWKRFGLPARIGLNTVLAGVVWWVIWLVIEAGWVSLRG